MGLLDGIDPRTQGLIAAGFQGMAASGPSRTPVSLGQIIGQGGLTGLNEYQQALQLRDKAALVQQQIEASKQQALLRQAQIDKMKRDSAMMDKVLGGNLIGGDTGSLENLSLIHI